MAKIIVHISLNIICILGLCANLCYAQFNEIDSIKFDPICGQLNLDECITESIRNSEFVFEGTVISSNYFEDSKGIKYIKVKYNIDKVFKGNLTKGQVERITNVDEILSEINSRYSKLKVFCGNSIPKFEAIAKPKVGTTGIIITSQKYSNPRKFNQANGENKLLYRHFNDWELMYKLGYRDWIVKENKSDIFFLAHNEKKISFKDCNQIYKFLLERVDDENHIDFTNKKFTKQTYEEWINNKNDNSNSKHKK